MTKGHKMSESRLRLQKTLLRIMDMNDVVSETDKTFANPAFPEPTRIDYARAILKLASDMGLRLQRADPHPRNDQKGPDARAIRIELDRLCDLARTTSVRRLCRKGSKAFHPDILQRYEAVAIAAKITREIFTEQHENHKVSARNIYGIALLTFMYKSMPDQEFVSPPTTDQHQECPPASPLTVHSEVTDQHHTTVVQDPQRRPLRPQNLHPISAWEVPDPAFLVPPTTPEIDRELTLLRDEIYVVCSQWHNVENGPAMSDPVPHQSSASGQVFERLANSLDLVFGQELSTWHARRLVRHQVLDFQSMIQSLLGSLAHDELRSVDPQFISDQNFVAIRIALRHAEGKSIDVDVSSSSGD